MVFNYDVKLQFFINNMDPFGPYKIKKITKKFDFFKSFHPIFDIDLLMPAHRIIHIFKNKHNIYCHMTVTQRMYIQGDTESDSLDPIAESILFSHIFIPFFTPTSFSNAVNHEDVITVGDDEPDVKSPGFREMACSLYSCEGLQENKHIINAILSKGAQGVDPGTALRFIIDQVSFPEVIIDKPDNTTRYETIVLSPHNLTTCIKDLQLRYGIYNGGVQIFWDPPLLYILNKFNAEHDYKTNIPSQSIFHLNTDLSKGGGMTNINYLKNTDLEYRFTCIPQKNNEDVYGNELFGDVMVFTNLGLSSGSVTYDTDANMTNYKKPLVTIQSPSQKHNKTGHKISVEYDELNNIYNMAAYAKSIAPHTTLTFPTIDQVAYDSFHPNSSFIIDFMNDKEKQSEIGGTYGIISGSLEFILLDNPATPYFFLNAKDILLIKTNED